MKLRHNDLIQLRKGGAVAITAKLKEVEILASTAHKDSLGKSPSNPKARRILRRTIAQLKSLTTEVQGVA